MSKKELIALGEKYCKTRPGSYLNNVDPKANTITTYFCGALITSDANKVKELLGINDDEVKIA